MRYFISYHAVVDDAYNKPLSYIRVIYCTTRNRDSYHAYVAFQHPSCFSTEMATDHKFKTNQWDFAGSNPAFKKNRGFNIPPENENQFTRG